MGGSLYNGTLGAQSNSSNRVESDSTPVPSFGRISARDSTISPNEGKSMSKALTFSETKFGQQTKKKSTKTNENLQNNDSMMNINPFVPSELNSKMSFE
jgi:hypothetical protein